MLGRVKIGDKLRVQVRGSKAYFPDGGVSGEVTLESLNGPDKLYEVHVDPETDKTTVPAQRWPTRAIGLLVREMSTGIMQAEVTAVRLVRRA